MLRRTVAALGVLGVFAIGAAVAAQLARQSGSDGAEARPTATTAGTGPGTTASPPTPGVRPPGVPPGGGDGGEEPPSVDELLSELEPASAAFDSPTSMKLGDSTEVELLVSRELTVEELQEELEGLGELSGETVRVSDTMEAQLAGVGFAVQQLTPAVQLVPGEGSTRWKWAVEATESGTQRLHLTLSAIVDQDGKDRQYTIRTFARTLDVDVTIRDRLSGFLEANWQWLWAALLVPVLGWAAQQRRRRKAGDTPPSALQP
jgi:hypothetical protein